MDSIISTPSDHVTGTDCDGLSGPSVPYSQIISTDHVKADNLNALSDSHLGPKHADDSDYIPSDPEIRQKYSSSSQGASPDVETKYLVHHENFCELIIKCQKCGTVVINSNVTF
jgi:hypothetical protein